MKCPNKKTPLHKSTIISRRDAVRMTSLLGVTCLGFPFESFAQQRTTQRGLQGRKLELDKNWFAHRKFPAPQLANQPLLGSTTPQPANQEEIEIAKVLADQFSHALASAVANPNQRFPPGSSAGRFQQDFLRLDPAKKMAAQQRARSILAEPLSERRQMFGTYADKGAGAHRDAQKQLDANLKNLIGIAVQKRCQQYRGEIEQYARQATEINKAEPGRSKPLAAKRKIAKTTQQLHEKSKTEIIDVGKFLKTDMPKSAGLSIVIHDRTEFLDFKWKTAEPKADKGVWQVIEDGTNKVIATGNAGTGKEGIFRVHFDQFIQAPPSSTPKVYLVRVLTYPKPVVQAAQANNKIRPGIRRARPTAQPVGWPSSPVRVTYIKSGVPITQFEDHYAYRKLDLIFDSIEMISQSCEGDTEEFHVTGFVQEDSKLTSSVHKMTHRYVEIDPDGERKKTFGWERSFHLQNPGTEYFPKLFTVVLCVMEEDDGESVAQWLKKIWKEAKDLIEPYIHGVVQSVVTDLIQQFTDIFLKQILEDVKLLGDIVQSVVSTIVSTIVGAIIQFIAKVVGYIIEGMADDIYQTAVFTFVLPSNLDKYVESLPGKLWSKKYTLKKEHSKQLHGPPCPGGATKYDGSVQLALHWELMKKEQVW